MYDGQTVISQFEWQTRTHTCHIITVAKSFLSSFLRGIIAQENVLLLSLSLRSFDSGCGFSFDARAIPPILLVHAVNGGCGDLCVSALAIGTVRAISSIAVSQ